MTNALQVLNPSAKLTELELLIMGEIETEDNSFDMIPTKVKIGSGGINQFVTSADETLKDFTGVVAVSQKARAYWPASDNKDMPPICTSADGVRGNFQVDLSDEQMFTRIKQKVVHPGVKAIDNGQQPQATYACATCPLAQWNSSEKGKGQACKSMRRLVVLIDGWTAPALLTLPPTSVKVWDTFASALQNKKSAYFAVKTAFSLEKLKSAGGDTYSVIKAVAAGALDKAQLEAVLLIRKEAADFVRNMAVERDEYDATSNGESVNGEPVDGKLIPF